jgi:aspartyl-tRNA(Asn)/glutamyl-tRNA(Gln) amidotransferase subunit C
MAKLSRDDVLKLARLARIEVTEEEVTSFADELSHILAYVEQLGSVDVSGLEPTSQVTGLVNVTREDTIVDHGYDVKDLRKNVPAMLDDQIKVKRMLG